MAGILNIPLAESLRNERQITVLMAQLLLKQISNILHGIISVLEVVIYI